MDSASVIQESFEYLDSPVEWIAGADVPLRYAANLEGMALPQIALYIYIYIYIYYQISGKLRTLN